MSKKDISSGRGIPVFRSNRSEEEIKEVFTEVDVVASLMSALEEALRYERAESANTTVVKVEAENETKTRTVIQNGNVIG